MEKKFKINGEEYEVHHYQHNDRQYIILKDGERLGTYDNYEELDEAIEELYEGNKEKPSLWKNGIFGIVVGDTLGVPVEFLSREEVEASPITDMIEGYHRGTPIGFWSDDSAMTLASLDSLIQCKEFDPHHMMDSFCRWRYEGEYTPFGQLFGIGNITLDAITRYNRNHDIYTCGGKDEYDNGNGSLMRILPLCIYLSKREDIEENKKLEMIHLASGLTHNHEISKISCGIYYFIVDEIIHKKKLSKTNILINAMNRANHYYESYEFYNRFIRLKEVMNFMKLPKEEIYSSGYVLHSLEASIWCFLNTSSYKECVLKAVNLGEDTDTTGAIVGGLAGLYYGYEDIPSSWINQLIRKEWIDQLCSQANLL